MAYIKDVQVGSETYLIEPALYIAPSKSGAAYTASLGNFSLVTGATVQAKFAATNDANATLNVNSTGAKEIHYNGAKITASQFKANHVYTLVYDGTQWQVVGDIDTNSNTWRGIQDNLTSDSTTDSLSAKQGKVLKGLIDAMDATTPAASGNATAFIDSITQTDGKITSITKKNIPTVSSSTAGLAPKGTAVSTQSTSTKFLREDGSWAAPSYIANTDAKVAQSSNTEDKEFPIILKNTNNTTNETNGVKYDGEVTVNPNKSRITATTIQANSRLVASKAISQIITGTGTAGSYTNSTYYPAKWTFNTGLTATDGDIFTIKIPIAGHDYGVFMSIDNGSHYYPVVLNGTGRITTHYPVNTYLTVIFEPTGSAASMFAVTGQTSSTRITVTGGVWRVLNYYDSNSNDTGYYHRRIYPNLKAGSGSIDKYTIIMQLPNGRWSSIVQAPSWTTNSNGSVIPKDTGKSASTNGFMLGHVLLMYANATYADGSNVATYNIWSAHTGLIDARYSFNLTSSAGFTAYTPVYIVGTVSDGLFHLDTTKWWSQTLPTSEDNKVYIYIGDAYDWYRLTFTEDKPMYWYKDGALRLYTEGRSIKSITRSGTTFTATRDDGSTFTFTQQDKYHKSGSWSGLTYTATAVNSADELKFTIPNKIQTNWELNATSGNSPALLFTRDSSLTDWKVFVASGKLSFQSATDGSTWTERAYFKDNSGDFVATSFTGKGSDLTNLNASNISSGTLSMDRIAAGAIANGKLANSKVTIAGNDVSLGGSLTAATLTSSLGLSNALHFIGITSTTLTDGSTTATLTAKSTNSLSKTTGFVDGDVVMDGDQLREYVWSGSAWRLLGITTSTAYTQPTSTATNTWIAQISQGTDGKITATTGSLNTSGTWSGNAGTATKLSTNASNTTASFWRGDNAWSSTLTGSITISKAGECGLEVINSQATNPHKGFFGGGSSGNLGIYDRTYNKWIVYSDPSGNVVLNGNANTATSAGKWTTARTLTIGNKGQSVDGSGNVSWSLADIGAAASGHNHSGTYVPNTTGANDVNTIYNTGIYNITSGSLTNGPRGYGYGQLLVMSYRKHTGNTTTDWATQIYSHLGSGNNGNTLYYRTSNASTWQTWQMAAHADAGTEKGGAKKPIYIDAQGAIQEGTELKNLAYKDSLSASDVGAAPAVTGGYLPLSGGTMTGAINTANNTWNKIGDDAQLGDINKAGHIGIQGINGNTGIFFTTYNQTTKTTGGAITWDGTKFSITSTTAVNASISGNAATATTATNLANNPSIQANTSNANQITITAGGKTSSAYTIPYATSAGSAASATTATYIKCTDTRNAALNPTDLNAASGVRFDFKAKGTIGLTATDSYAGVMSFRPYASGSDWSGGNAHQIAFNSEGLHWRNGGASWGNWYQILDSNNTAAGANATATLSWGSTYTLAKINGTDIKVTMPGNPNTNTTYTFAEGSTNGAFSVTPSGGSAQSVSIHGLGTAAYKAVGDFAATSHSHSYLANTNAGAADRPIYITGNAATQTTYRMAGTNVGATTGLTYSNDLDTGIWYVNGISGTDKTALYNQSDGVIIANKYSTSWISEIYQDYRTGQLAIRGKNNGTWAAWRNVLDSSNYTDYAVTYAGNITGIGGGSPASGAQTWWKNTTNVPKLSVVVAYNNSGAEKTMIFSKGNADATYGSILMWGYSDRYLRILRKSNSNADTWATTDWEKIDAGYADSAGTATTSTWTTLLKPIASTTTAGASTWNIPSGSYQVWGERFSDTRLKYTPSGGSETTVTDTGDWTIWLTPNATSNAATLNMRIDGTYYGSFSGNLSGNASTATKSGTAAIWLYPENNNEINFGGTNTNTTLYVGYRTKGSRPIPTKFVFGSSTGTADLQAKTVYLGSGTSSYISSTQYTGNAATATNISSKTPTLAASTESNEIKVIDLGNDSPVNAAAQRHAIDFKWYDSHWAIGNLRSGSTPSAGFGFSYSDDGGTTYSNLVTISTSGKITATGGFSGNLIGNVTGNVTGNVSGTAANVTGTVAVANGGTGATTAANARTNLGLGSAATYNITGGNEGYSSSATLIPRIGTDGVMEVGKYIDFHASTGTSKDYDVRITAATTGLTISGTTSGTFSGNLSGNASTATTATNLSAAPTIASGGTATVTLSANTAYTLTVGGKSVIFKTPADNNNDTKNTAGSTNSDSKLYLIGATSQAANPQTYSDSHVFETNGAFSAKTLGVNADTDNNKVTLQWNSTDSSLDFIFA